MYIICQKYRQSIEKLYWKYILIKKLQTNQVSYGLGTVHYNKSIGSALSLGRFCDVTFQWLFKENLKTQNFQLAYQVTITTHSKVFL